MPLVRGEVASHETEFYITECTWMRKHGWRTPEWKLIVALEPDFHFKPPVELYNLVEDPEEIDNLAESHPEIVADLTRRMEAWIARREAETGLPNPIHNQPGWHGHADDRLFHQLAAGLRHAAHRRPGPGRAAAIAVRGSWP